MALQVKAVVPPALNPKAWERVIGRELEKQAAITQRMYKRTVRTWGPPKITFKVKTSKTSPGPRGGRSSQTAAAEVSTDDERFIWTDLGTKAHIIRPKRPGGQLKFKVGGYSPKTRRGVIGSRRGRAGRNFRSATIVRHPGTKARRFTKEIEKRRRKPFFKAMFAANAKGLRAAQRGR